MSQFKLDDLVEALSETQVTSNGISFAGKGLKLDNENDVKDIILAIKECKDLEYLNLEGNTLGIEASKYIALALETHSEFKRALWKDMFTGRMKTEIPKCLEYLGESLMRAGARLTELDLSDNAFGPIGVQGLANLLKSPTCYALQVLRLNNNGLGIGGGGLLAKALLEGHKASGGVASLRIFVAGRNRLENKGAQALAQVFKTFGSLEEIVMPQNGIYHVGISALSDSFRKNPNLRILDLNDNTIGPKGAKAISEVLPYLKYLESINFGDCLLKTTGVKELAKGIESCSQLEELILGFNEIRTEGALTLLESLKDKQLLRSLVLDGNQFGKNGRSEISSHLKLIGKFNTLSSLDEDESCSEEDEEEAPSEQSSNDEEEQERQENEESLNLSVSTGIVQNGAGDTSDLQIVSQTSIVEVGSCTVEEYVKLPTSEHFMALGEQREQVIADFIDKSSDRYIEEYIPIVMKTSVLIGNNKSIIAEAASNCVEHLYKEIFAWAQTNMQIPLLNNTLLVNLGLIKSEDKLKPTWNVEICLEVLEKILRKNIVPKVIKDTLKVFIKREIDAGKDFLDIKKKLLEALN